MATDHQSAYNAAIDAGDWDAARQIKGFLEASDSQAMDAQEKAEIVRAQGIKDEVDAMYNEGRSEFDDLSASIGRGFHDVKRGVQGLYASATGNDALQDRIDTDRAKEAELFQRMEDRSPVIAGSGRVVGQAAAMAPIGLVGRGAALAAHGGKAAFGANAATLTANARFGVGLAEGATAGFVGTDGNMEDRTVAALAGGAMGGSAESAIGGVASHISRNAQKGIAGEAAVAKQEAMVADDIAKNQEAGGYTKDYNDVVGDQNSLDVRDTARNVPNNDDVNRFAAKQEADILDRSRELQGEQGGTPLTPNQVGEGIQDNLGTARVADEASVDAKYDAWRATHGGDIMVDTKGFSNIVKEQLKDVRFGQKGVAKDIEDILTDHDININGKGRALSVDDVEKVIQDINSIYKAADGPSNRAAGKVKKALDEWVIDGFGDIDNLPANSPIRTGKEARIAMRENSVKWNSDEAISKITATRKGSDDPTDYLKTATWALGETKKKGNIKDLRKIKLELDKTPAGKQAWRDLGTTELFDAMEKAVPTGHQRAMTAGDGIDNFDSKAYSDHFNKMDTETQDAIFGVEGAQKIRDNIRSWSERGKLTGTRGDPTKLGSARSRNVLQAGVRLGVSGTKATGAWLAALPIISGYVERTATKSILKQWTANSLGKMSEPQKKALIKKTYEAFEASSGPTLVNTHGAAYMGMLRGILTPEQETDEAE